MTAATVIDFQIMNDKIENTDNAIRRHSGCRLFRNVHQFLPIFGVLLGTMAMKIVFTF
jgi:hypothetical protein